MITITLNDDELALMVGALNDVLQTDEVQALKSRLREPVNPVGSGSLPSAESVTQVARDKYGLDLNPDILKLQLGDILARLAQS